MITTDAAAMLLLVILVGVALIAAACLAAFLVLAARRRRRTPAEEPPSPQPDAGVARPISGSSPRALLVTERVTAHQLLTGEIDRATYRARMRELAVRAESAATERPWHIGS